MSQNALFWVCCFKCEWAGEEGGTSRAPALALAVLAFATKHFTIKGVVDCFFLGLIVFMGYSQTCVHAKFLKNALFSHNLPLFHTSLPLLWETPRLFPGFMKPLPQKYVKGSDWLAGPVCCDSLNRLYCASERPAPQLSGMCSGCIVNNGILYNSHVFKK